jgi:hypothetical protein
MDGWNWRHFGISNCLSPKRLVAAGFGEFQPIDSWPHQEAFSRNRPLDEINGEMKACAARPDGTVEGGLASQFARNPLMALYG